MAVCALAGCGGGADVTTISTGEPDAGTTATETTTGGSTAAATAVGDGEGGVRLEQLGEFEQPVYLTQPPSGDDEHLYVVEQCGRIQRLPLGGGDSSTFLDLSELVTCGGEQGLLSVAFAPDYADSGLLYVNYTGKDSDSHTVEYSRSAGDPAVADPETARELLKIDDFAPNHNGGLLLFGPDDQLYLGMGDGGGAGDPERTAQNPDSPLGKLLNIDTGGDGGYEVAALGLRNPWRYSFDPDNGDLWIGDVGQDTFEEIDAVTDLELHHLDSTLNFGWSAFEGTERYNEDQEAPAARPPVYEYGRDRGCSVTGGYVVRDRELASLYGRYLYGDYCEGELHSFTADPSQRANDDRALGLRVEQLSSFGADASGKLYALSLLGPVYRLAPDG
ncbi:MAG: PQQ-dependent sugar dehydrogenase [Vicinamibacteria bacterium]